MFDQLFIKELANALAPQVAELLVPRLSSKITPRYLSVAQAADYLSTTPAAIRGMLRARHFPVCKMGSRNFLDIREIDKAMSANLEFLG
jgi:hypothetical protein